MSRTALSPDPKATEQDLSTYLAVAWRRKWVLLAVVVALPLLVLAVSASAPDRYESSALLQVQSQVVDLSLFTSTPAESAQAPEQALNAAARLIETRDVARRAARRLDPPRASPSALLSQVAATPDTASGFITISATDQDPVRAADIANAFAAAVVEVREQTAAARIEVTIAQIERNIDLLATTDGVGRRQLSQQLQRLRALRAAQGNNAQIVEAAVPSSSPVSPRPMRNAALALVIALLLAAGLVFLLERFDRRVRDPLEFEQLSGAPLLSIIPASGFSDPPLEPDAAEAFQTLRASLTYFNVSRPLKCVVVTSSVKGDGKTTVSTQLAIAAASSGKDVVLVDCDLRHPQVDARFGRTSAAGLGAVLAGEKDLSDVLLEEDVPDGRLRTLPSGPPPPNPSQLIGSERMRSLLAELSASADLVVLDTPPLLVVSDAIPLLEQASGVVVVGRLDQTTREEMRRLREVATNAGGTILGVVATGAKQGGPSGLGGYGGYGYANAAGSDGPRQNGPGITPVETGATRAVSRRS